MLLGHLLLHYNYTVLPVNESADAAESSHPIVDSTTLLKIASSNLPLLPVLFSDYPLPPDICVPEQLILR